MPVADSRTSAARLRPTPRTAAREVGFLLHVTGRGVPGELPRSVRAYPDVASAHGYSAGRVGDENPVLGSRGE